MTKARKIENLLRNALPNEAPETIRYASERLATMTVEQVEALRK